MGLPGTLKIPNKYWAEERALLTYKGPTKENKGTGIFDFRPLSKDCIMIYYPVSSLCESKSREDDSIYRFNHDVTVVNMGMSRR